jgi:hypothetical protein
MIPDFITMQHDQRRPEAFLQSGQAEFRGSHGMMEEGLAGLVQKGMHFDDTIPPRLVQPLAANI